MCVCVNVFVNIRSDNAISVKNKDERTKNTTITQCDIIQLWRYAFGSIHVVSIYTRAANLIHTHTHARIKFLKIKNKERNNDKRRIQETHQKSKFVQFVFFVQFSSIFFLFKVVEIRAGVCVCLCSCLHVKMYIFKFEAHA